MTAKPVHPLSYPLPDAWDAAIIGWLTYLVAAGTSPATRRTRRAHVRSVAHDLGMAAPNDVETADMLAILGRPAYSIEHRRGLRSSLASFYRWCVSKGIVDDDPTAALPVIRTPIAAPKPATDEIWAQILATADQRTRLMARLAGEAGLRRAEVAQVHTDDLVTSAEGSELIVHGKGDKQRVVPVTATLADAIANYCPFGGFLFPGQIDGHMSPDRVGHLVSKVMPKGWSMHRLRHRFATRGYAGTGNLRAVQEVLGHTNVATTQRYVAVSSRDIRSVSEAAAGTAEKHLDQSTPTAAPKRAAPVDRHTVDFENVISRWDDVLPCEVGTLTTYQAAVCKRRANWRLNFHGCTQRLMCGHHLQAWKRSYLAGLHQGHQMQCVHCEKTFDQFDAACSITRL
jgi:site-specific recombinase XerD